jgi:four helix bundle protein
VASARHFTDLDCWKLANELKVALYGVGSRPEIRRDSQFYDQLMDAAASAPRNIAEGFGRRTHREFARYLDIARASLNECNNHVRDAVDRGYLTKEESLELLRLVARSCGAISGLQRHLRATKGP